MATQTLALADAILKDLYVGPIVEQLNQKTFMLDQIERDSEHIDHTGRRAVVPVHKNRNRGRGSIGDGGTLPVAGRQDWMDAIIGIRYHLYGIELTDAAIEGSKRSEGAFVSLLEAESKGVATDMRKDINRQVFGTGDGILTLVVSNAAGVVTVDTNQYIQVGDTVDILVAATGATTNGVVGATVTARATGGWQTGTITVSPAPAGAVAGTYAVYITGNRNQEMDGLRNIISASRTLHAINSATAGNEFWNGFVQNVGASMAALATGGESFYEQAYDGVGRVGHGDVDVFLTTRGVRRRLADTYASQKRMNDARMVDVHGGYTAIMVNETPVIADDDAPAWTGFGVNRDSFKWYEQVKPGWLESRDGNVFQLKTAGTGTYASVWQAWFKWYAALGNHAPNRNAVLRFMNDDNPA